MEQTANFYDVVVIGGGPAGLTAALYLARARYRVVVVEKDHFGGQITITSEVVNYPGVGRTSGTELTETMRKQAEGFGAEFLLAEVTGLELSGDIKTVRTGRGDLRCFGVLLATGAHPRMVGFQGEEAFRGRGVAYCATCDGMLYRGKPVAVVGYTDTARQEAEFLQKIGCSVTYFDRPKQCEIRGDGRVESVTCDGRTIPAEGVFILRPTMAPTELFPGLAVEQGYVTVDRRMATNLPGLFAAGDCTGGPLQVSKAAGDGLIAGQSAAAWAAAHPTPLPCWLP